MLDHEMNISDSTLYFVSRNVWIMHMCKKISFCVGRMSLTRNNY